MSQRQPSRPSPLLRAVKRYSVSAFVICSFSAYAVHERMLSADAAAVSQAPGAAITRQVAALPQPRQAAAAAVAAKPMQIAATKATPVQMLPPAPPAATVSGTYRDGVSWTQETAQSEGSAGRLQRRLRRGFGGGKATPERSSFC